MPGVIRYRVAWSLREQILNRICAKPKRKDSNRRRQKIQLLELAERARKQARQRYPERDDKSQHLWHIPRRFAVRRALDLDRLAQRWHWQLKRLPGSLAADGRVYLNRIDQPHSRLPQSAE